MADLFNQNCNHRSFLECRAMETTLDSVSANLSIYSHLPLSKFPERNKAAFEVEHAVRTTRTAHVCQGQQDGIPTRAASAAASKNPGAAGRPQRCAEHRRENPREAAEARRGRSPTEPARRPVPNGRTRDPRSGSRRREATCGRGSGNAHAALTAEPRGSPPRCEERL